MNYFYRNRKGIPELFRAAQGFWFMISNARTDFAMFCGIIFMLMIGAGGISIDNYLSKNKSG